MKNNGITFLILFYLSIWQISCQLPITQFTNTLWKLDCIGVPTDINFLNESEILAATNKGVVAKIDVKKGTTIWKKLYKSNIKINTNDQCINKIIILIL